MEGGKEGWMDGGRERGKLNSTPGNCHLYVLIAPIIMICLLTGSELESKELLFSCREMAELLKRWLLNQSSMKVNR